MKIFFYVQANQRKENITKMPYAYIQYLRKKRQRVRYVEAEYELSNVTLNYSKNKLN